MKPRAALFTRRNAAGKVALGDTNAELSMPPVDPRRERMEEPYDTGDARVQQTVPVQARTSDRVSREAKREETTITLKVRPGTEEALLPLLEDLKLLGGWGASRSIIIDDFTDEEERFGDGHHFFDGDGSDQIYDIKVTKGKEDDPDPDPDKAPKDGNPDNHRDPGCNAIGAVMEEQEDTPGFESGAFWDFCVEHNRADCDSGELDNINEDEIHRLFDAFMAKKRKKADVQMHKTPPKGAPRMDQRTHLDEDLQEEMNPKTDDPDLVRHTRTGRLFP